MTGFPGLLMTGLAVYAAWNAAGWARSRSPDLPVSARLLPAGLLAVAVALLMTRFTSGDPIL